MDLLTMFREFTEGKPIQNITKILGNQIDHFEATIRRVNNFQAKAKNPTNATASTQPQNPPATRTAASLFHDIEETTHTLKPTPKPTNKQLAEARKKAKYERRLVLIKQSETAYDSYSPLQLRNDLNAAFKSKYNANPVISTITKSLTNNLIITTTEEFNAKWVLERIDAFEEILTYKHAKLDIQCVSVVAHGIPLQEFNSPEGLETLRDEILTFNKSLNLNLIGNPRWLTSQEKRQNPHQYSGSIVIDFESDTDAKKAIRNRLIMAGISARVEALHNTSPRTQCSECQGYGHLPQFCKKGKACRICAEEHATPQHQCGTCNTIGKACQHTIYKCINCDESHPANDRNCEFEPTLPTRKL